ncbi:MAG: hypothetical protein ABSF13_10945 [Smithella sp.]
MSNLTIVGLKVKGPVSIEVATVDPTVSPTTTNEMLYNIYETHNMSPTFVHIGLGTGNANDNPSTTASLAIGMTSLSADVVLDRTKTLTNRSGVLGSIYLAGVSARVNGWVHIGAH